MFRVSCIQLKSNNSFNDNFAKTEKLIKKAIKQKTDFILTPEISSIFLLDKKQLLKICSSMDKDNYLIKIKKLAKKFKKWILIGSLIIKTQKNKLVNRSVLIDNKGMVRSYYDKIHMYDVTLSKKEKYFESKTFTPGKKYKVTKLPWGKLGMSICYDLRFPNLYRKLTKKGAQFFSIPAAFTFTTGKAHWHSLIRARAIENGCFVFAPAQCGVHDNGRRTYGHSMIVNPWGKVLVEANKNKKQIISTIINIDEIGHSRKKIPSMTQF